MDGSISRVKVALVRCEDYEPARVGDAVRRQWELLGGVETFIQRGDTVLLKPNFIAPRSHRHSAAQTHPAVILETARLLKDYGARPFVADSPAWTNAAVCARVLGLTEPLRRLGVPIRQLNAPRMCRLAPGGPKVGISAAALDADVIVNLPKFKTHQQMVATFAVKNMFGCVSGKRKALWHFRKGNTAERVCRAARRRLSVSQARRDDHRWDRGHARPRTDPRPEQTAGLAHRRRSTRLRARWSAPGSSASSPANCPFSRPPGRSATVARTRAGSRSSATPCRPRPAPALSRRA